MSDRCQNEAKSPVNLLNCSLDVSSFKRSENLSTVIDIGVSNAKRWNSVKRTLACVTDEEFTRILLDLVEDQAKRKASSDNVTEKWDINSQNEEAQDLETEVEEAPPLLPLIEAKSKLDESMEHPEETNQAASSNLEICFQENINKDNSIEIKLEPKELIIKKENTVPLDLILTNSLINCQKSTKVNVKVKQFKNRRKSKHQFKDEKKSEKRTKRKICHDIRKAPELEIQSETENKASEAEIENESIAIKIKMCFNCGTHHVQEMCPLHNAHFVIVDAVNFDSWCEKYNDLYKNSLESQDDVKYSFAYISLPSMLSLDESNTTHGLSVFSKCEIREFTQFGPLIGKTIKEVDISEDFSMRNLWEVYSEKENIYVNTENVDESNWIRFIRPADVRENRNVMAVSRENQLFFITTKSLSDGDELLYWQDDAFKTNKKKMEKTTCGGCNMTFTHPLYYRTHCSIFHDIRYSLTIRKYHCKICGAAVLGKENIMKHAAELHNGQGAYQCQFCKKFFLRLNYLEMHRTYGCSANPHRSRPLCDFCGRKFCQPQKLKVHIKRMHSDISEVLKEFQCKNCLKILGSRAALQRHLKEVHHKQVDGACACSRCGKLFQNKSNLKIHMLTHSGIKPFKCGEKSCVAAFTTKQCLQFHYKKVHGFTEDMMPKIERTVEYTFEAYSGVDDAENNDEKMNSKEHDDEGKYMDDSSDLDENSMDDKNLDDPPPLHSPIPINNEHSSESNTSPPTLEAYTASNMKILSKGSKKWIGNEDVIKTDGYMENRAQKLHELNLNVEDQSYEPSTNLNGFSRRESSNASLLVEAALDSVCSESHIDTTSNCADPLNNLYTLAHADTLPDVTYSHSIDMNETRDINLISPSVNDHISVTDDLNDELRHSQNIGMDYSSFQQEDFSQEGSPGMPSRSNFRDYINVSPQDYKNPSKNASPVPTPPRYDFGHAAATEHLSSDDSGMGAQNLSLHGTNKNIQLDLSIYKSPYNLDSTFQLRKDFRIKFDSEEIPKNYEETKFVNPMDGSELSDKDFETIQNVDVKEKESYFETIRNMSDVRNKFEIDLDLRVKNSESFENEFRGRVYENVDDFRKNYETSDGLDTRSNLDVRNKIYDSLIESDFRSDRNFEPLVINSELQGLDMSARSYHNYSNLNRYHHLYADVERPGVELRLNYSPPPPTYTHADILRVVSIDLTPPGRHSVDLSLRSQIANSRLLSEHPVNPHRLALDQSRILGGELTGARHITSDSRLISELGNRILSDHTTNRILSNDQLSTNRLITTDQRLIGDDSRLLTDQSRLLDQGRLLGESRILPAPPTGAISPVPYTPYSVSPTPYHPTALPPRPHATSPTPSPYHHYSTYY